MAKGKKAADRIALRGGIYYYTRRVPTHLAAFDPRVIVRISLHTSDKAEAGRAADIAERELELLWGSLAGQHGAEAWQRYQAAMERARLEGFAYRVAGDLAQARLSEVMARIESLADRREDPSAAAALLGGIPKPEITLTAALEQYFQLSKPDIIGKRQDQVRRWENPRRLAIETFKTLLGEDKPITELTREDARRFRDHWLERISAEKLGRNSANKQIGHLGRILQVVSDELKLGLEPIFAKLALSEKKQTRPPFERAFVEETLLKSGALDGLNIEGRAALLLCMETGMGAEEVSSLLPEHIHLQAPIPYISIVSRDEAEQKTEYRPRDIPLVGAALLAAKACPLGLPRYRGKPASLSAAVNKYLRENKLLPSAKHSLYALRHSFQDRLTAAEAPDRLQADLMGHKYVRERYGKGPDLAQKQKWLRAIAYRVPDGFTV